MGKRTFWQKITGAMKADDVVYDELNDYEDAYEDDEYYQDDSLEDNDGGRGALEQNRIQSEQSQMIETTPVMELPLDVYQDSDNIYITAFIPGVSLSNINIELSREMISIEGERVRHDMEEVEEVFSQELEWGEFARTVSLPEEIDIDTSTATESAGVLHITLPKFNKSRKAKLTVKSIKK